jgi:hypothetical protein
VTTDGPTPEHLASRRQLDTAGEKLRATREAQKAALELARIAALDSIALGTPESVVAQELGVDRMTVRKWVGKR